MDALVFIKDPKKKIGSLIRKITHAGEIDLDKKHLSELKEICKSSRDDIQIDVFKECMKNLKKEHSQIRVATVKLIDYFFHKSHIIRVEVLDNFDLFLELTLAVTMRPKVAIKLPPPKKHAALLQEMTAKFINAWHSEYGKGYERLRYSYKFLHEHRLVNFSAFTVSNHENQIRKQKLAEKQERILTLLINNRLTEFRLIKPEIEQILAQIESLLDIIASSCVANSNDLDISKSQPSEPLDEDRTRQHHGISNLSRYIEIEFSPFFEVERTRDIEEAIQTLKEIKKELVGIKLTKLIAIEKTLAKRGGQFVNTLKEIIDLKRKSMELIIKLSELRIVGHIEDDSHNEGKVIDNVDSDSDDDSELEEVELKEDLETYIPKSMRSEYGLQAIDPREKAQKNTLVLVDESFSHDAGPSCSTDEGLAMACNFRLESGKLCPRRDKKKCPFHGKIIPRDSSGVPLNSEDRILEEKSNKKNNTPDWQDPELLRELKVATGVDLTMPVKGSKANSVKKLANVKTCDLTPKRRLQRRLQLLSKH